MQLCGCAHNAIVPSVLRFGQSPPANAKGLHRVLVLAAHCLPLLALVCNEGARGQHLAPVLVREVLDVSDDGVQVRAKHVGGSEGVSHTLWECQQHGVALPPPLRQLDVRLFRRLAGITDSRRAVTADTSTSTATANKHSSRIVVKGNAEQRTRLTGRPRRSSLGVGRRQRQLVLR